VYRPRVIIRDGIERRAEKTSNVGNLETRSSGADLGGKANESTLLFERARDYAIDYVGNHRGEKQGTLSRAN